MPCAACGPAACPCHAHDTPTRTRARAPACMQCTAVASVWSHLPLFLTGRYSQASQPRRKKGCVQVQVQVQSGRDASTMKKFRFRRYSPGQPLLHVLILLLRF